MLHLFLKPAHLSVETCYIFFGEMLRLSLKGTMSFWKRCYVFFKQAGVTLMWSIWVGLTLCHNLPFHDYLETVSIFIIFLFCFLINKQNICPPNKPTYSIILFASFYKSCEPFLSAWYLIYPLSFACEAAKYGQWTFFHPNGQTRVA